MAEAKAQIGTVIPSCFCLLWLGGSDKGMETSLRNNTHSSLE
jgi:hypothetical protein